MFFSRLLLYLQKGFDMEITKVSKDAFAVFAACARTRQYFGISVDPVARGQYKFVWAFKISKDQAVKEGFDRQQVKGAISVDPGFNFWPHCGGQEFVQCGNCGKFFCYYEGASSCPHCGQRIGQITTANEFSFGGGGF